MYGVNSPEKNYTKISHFGSVVYLQFTVTKVGGHHILEEEVVKALNSMPTGKAAGPDRVLTEMILALEDFGIAKITQLANKIYTEGSFPTEMCKSIFINLPKKPATIKCDQHRTISLMGLC